MINEFNHFFLSIKSWQRLIRYKRIVCVIAFSWEKSRWIAIISLEDSCQNLMLIAKIGGSWSPEENQRSVLRIHAFDLFLEIYSAEEHCFKAHLCIESCIGIWMTKCINIPSYSRSDSEFFIKPLKTKHHIINNILIICISLIISYPSPINNLQLPVLKQHLNSTLHFLLLPLIPHTKEPHLRITKPPFRILRQLLHNSIQYIPNTSVLSRKLTATIILIHSLDPP